MVPVRQDNVGDVWLLGVVVGALEQRLLEIRDVFLPALASVEKNVRVAFSDEVCVRSCPVSCYSWRNIFMVMPLTLERKLSRILMIPNQFQAGSRTGNRFTWPKIRVTVLLICVKVNPSDSTSDFRKRSITLEMAGMTSNASMAL